MTSRGTHRKGLLCIRERNGFVSKGKNLLLAPHPGHGNVPKQTATPEASVDFGLTNLARVGYSAKSKGN